MNIDQIRLLLANKYLRIVTLAGVFLLLLFVFVKNFTSASVALRNVKVTNITDTALSISWTTAKPTQGQVLFSSNPNDLTIPFLRNLRLASIADEIAKSSTVHHVTLTGLSPNTTYYYLISSEGKSFGKDAQGKSFPLAKTSAALKEVAQPRPIFGQVKLANKKIPRESVVVYLKVKNQNHQFSAGLSAISRPNGFWLLDLGNLRTSDGGASFTYAEGDTEMLSVQAGSLGSGRSTFAVGQDQPTVPILLGLGGFSESGVVKSALAHNQDDPACVDFGAPGLCSAECNTDDFDYAVHCHASLCCPQTASTPTPTPTSICPPLCPGTPTFIPTATPTKTPTPPPATPRPPTATPYKSQCENEGSQCRSGICTTGQEPDGVKGCDYYDPFGGGPHICCRTVTPTPTVPCLADGQSCNEDAECCGSSVCQTTLFGKFCAPVPTPTTTPAVSPTPTVTPAPPAPEGYVRVRGRVERIDDDERTLLVDNAHVIAFGNIFAYSQSNGEYSGLVLTNRSAFGVIAAKEIDAEDWADSGTCEVDESSNCTVDFTLSKGPVDISPTPTPPEGMRHLMMTGTVRREVDGQGENVAGAAISLGGADVSTITDRDGAYRFVYKVPVDIVRLQARARKTIAGMEWFDEQICDALVDPNYCQVDFTLTQLDTGVTPPPDPATTISGNVFVNQDVERVVVIVSSLVNEKDRGPKVGAVQANLVSGLPIDGYYQYEYRITQLADPSYVVGAQALEDAVYYENEHSDCSNPSSDPGSCIVNTGQSQNFTINLPIPDLTGVIEGDLTIRNSEGLGIGQLYVLLCDIREDGSADCNTRYSFVGGGENRPQGGHYRFENLVEGQRYIVNATAHVGESHFFNPASDCAEMGRSGRDCVMTATGSQDLSIAIEDPSVTWLYFYLDYIPDDSQVSSLGLYIDDNLFKIKSKASSPPDDLSFISASVQRGQTHNAHVVITFFDQPSQDIYESFNAMEQRMTYSYVVQVSPVMPARADIEVHTEIALPNYADCFTQVVVILDNPGSGGGTTIVVPKAEFGSPYTFWDVPTDTEHEYTLLGKMVKASGDMVEVAQSETKKFFHTRDEIQDLVINQFLIGEENLRNLCGEAGVEPGATGVVRALAQNSDQTGITFGMPDLGLSCQTSNETFYGSSFCDLYPAPSAVYSPGSVQGSWDKLRGSNTDYFNVGGCNFGDSSCYTYVYVDLSAEEGSSSAILQGKVVASSPQNTSGLDLFRKILKQVFAQTEGTIASATVKASAGAYSFSARSNNKGEYTLSLTAGFPYQISVAAEGYKTLETEFSPSGNLSYQSDFFLEPGDPSTVGGQQQINVQGGRVRLKPGWNLVGVNVNPGKELSGQSLMQGEDGRPRALQSSFWDPETSSWQSYVYGVAGQSTDIVPGQATMIKSDTSQTWEVAGSEITQPIPLNLSVGLNLFGIPYPPNQYTAKRVIDGVNSVINSVTDEVTRFESGLYESFIKKDSQTFGQDFPIESNRGYFIKVNQGVTWTP